ncbi:unnamed protein product [Cuscuta epithymum]|uniref:Protein FAR1-RELATED SEQUENCE n=1 Tax=Cuscuta epithymum TaxID=186058 RepID=A0AAV0FRS7_9ASTE|nr:unnamed protein product [Cuscuta epithymum]
MEPDPNCALQISPGDSKYWLPQGSPEKKPTVGMIFCNVDAAFTFYKQYAAELGFTIRHHASKKARDGHILFKYIVCNRAGFKNKVCPPVSDANLAGSEVCQKNRKRVSNRIGCKARITLKYVGVNGYSIFAFEECHNHAMSSEVSKQFLKANRNLDIGHQKFILNCFRANIGTMKSYRLYKETVGGYSNIGATAVDFKNFKRDLMAYISGVDAQIVVDKLFRKQDVCSAFFFDYDVDDTDQLTRLFWADPICRKNYALFGDVVSFDATYGTNRYNMVFGPFTGVDNHRKCITFGAGLLLKEDVESYVWLFTRFINAMARQPTCIITDQDPAMRIAIEKVFTSSKHRYCMWHIMNKVTQKVGPVLSKNETFMSSLNSIVWSHYLEPSQFEEKWISLMHEYELTTHDWFCHMFELRRWWIRLTLEIYLWLDCFVQRHVLKVKIPFFVNLPTHISV